MSTVVLFHSVLGVRAGVTDAADRLRADGHDVVVPDLFEGRTFDAYLPAMAFADELGMPTLFARGLEAVAEVPDGFVVAGFSMGSNVAGHVATQRPVAGLLQLAGVSILEWFGDEVTWPDGLRSQAHQTLDDPFREPEVLEQVIRELPGLEVFDYPGTGHLFNDPTLPDEYDAAATELLWSRVLPFVRACG
jgi:dienelactone hydrolase